MCIEFRFMREKDGFCWISICFLKNKVFYSLFFLKDSWVFGLSKQQPLVTPDRFTVAICDDLCVEDTCTHRVELLESQSVATESRASMQCRGWRHHIDFTADMTIVPSLAVRCSLLLLNCEPTLGATKQTRSQLASPAAATAYQNNPLFTLLQYYLRRVQPDVLYSHGIF